MKGQKIGFSHRIIAFFLSLTIMLSLLPTEAFHAYAADLFTVTVMDKEDNTPIEGATVTLRYDGEETSAATDSSGKAGLDLAAWGEAPFAEVSYTVSADNYISEEGTISDAELVGTLDVVLESTLQKIPAEDYTISNTENVYDGQEHILDVTATRRYTVEYSEDGENYTDQVPSIKEVGEKTVYVKISRRGYKTVVETVLLKIIKITRTDFVFENEGPVKKSFKTDEKEFVNTAAASVEPSEVSYNSSDETIATVDETGKVTFVAPGTVTITATMAETDHCYESKASYVITYTAPRTGFGFETETPAPLAYAENLTFENPAVDADNSGEIRYEIVSQKRDGEDVADIATVDANGKVAITASGEITVKAIVESDEFDSAEATYTLVINRGTRDFAFEQDFTSEPKNLVFNETFKNVIAGAVENAVTYSGDDDKIVSVNSTTGEITAKGVGMAVITAVQPQDSCYEESTAAYKVSVAKAEQTGFAFETPVQELGYGTKELELITAGGDTEGKVTYSVQSDPNGIVEKITDNIVSFKSNKTEGTVIIKAVKAGDEFYNEAEATATITIVTEDMNNYTVEGTKGLNGWYTSDVEIKADKFYTISTSYDFNGDWTDKIVITDEGITAETVVYLKNIIGLISNPNTVKDIMIDQTAPTDITIEYPVAILEETTENIAFYNETIEVKVSAKDAVSGVAKFICTVGEDTITLIAEKDAETENLFTATFTIDPMYKGKISVKAIDVAGLETEFTDEKTIVVDNTAPEISVEYNDDEVFNDKYFDATRTATITITEDSFYPEDVVVTATKDGEVFPVELTFTSDEESEDGVYIATVGFAEDGHYTFDIIYTDKSGNASRDYEEDIFVVDTVDPVMSITYDNIDVSNGKYFAADRVATIKITEANFDAADVFIAVEKQLNDKEEYENATPEIVFVASEDENDPADTYVATVEFNEDADYKFTVYYTDKANRAAADFEDEFVIDKIAPVITVTYNNNTTVFAENNCYNADRTATIVVTEHNFNAAAVAVTSTKSIKASDKEEFVTEEFITYLNEYEKWSHDGDVHTAVINYTEEAVYTFAIECKDMAENDSQPTDYADSKDPERFLIDKTRPTDLKVEVDNTTVASAEKENIVFNHFYHEPIVVKFSADSGLSEEHSLHYQKVVKENDYKPEDEDAWIKYDATNGVAGTPNEEFILFFRATDKAGNQSFINSYGIIVDDKDPIGENSHTDIDIIPDAPNSNTFYNKNVNVDIVVVDPKFIPEGENDGNFSGIKTITYEIYATDIGAKKEGVLYNHEDGTSNGGTVTLESHGLAHKWKGSITVDAARFNSNLVTVKVTALDNAGNGTTTYTKEPLKIDITQPEITVTYDNNSAENTKYFKNDRTATIVVKERNCIPDNILIEITNTDGVKPSHSGWVKTEPTDANGDNTTYTTTILYNADGDYTFDIGYTDLAGNANKPVNYGTSIVPQEFTIDKTVPVVKVSYSNNDAQNGNYYKADRTANIEIVEHNIDPAVKEQIDVSVAASDDGNPITAPGTAAWGRIGDSNTTSIGYTTDGYYEFDIVVKDMAGNVAADYPADKFYVDKTAPSLEITGVANNSANKGNVIPVVTYSDTNYDPAKVTITLTGANRDSIGLDGVYTDIHNGRIFTFTNFRKDKEFDDVYTLVAELTDKAGNTTNETIRFSVNRFGSTYELSDSTKSFVGSYIQTPKDVVITETNVNELDNITVTLFKNNETITLKEGEDYRLDIYGGYGQWYRYTYTILKKNFADDAVYRIVLYSEDKAGNVSENTLDTKNTEISFGIDKTNPTIVVANLESEITYNLDSLTAEFSANDNLLLESVTVYLDDYNKPYKTWMGEELANIMTGNGDFSFVISGDSTKSHNVKIVVKDAAGNEISEEITDFYVTTNLFIRYYTNKPLFYGSIGGGIGLAAFILIFLKKKKDDEEQR